MDPLMADATDTTSAVATESTESTDTESTTDWEAEAKKWEARSKANSKNLTELRAAAKELEEFKQASMSDQEKAVAEAEAKALAKGRSEGLGRVVSAEVKAAAAGRIADVDALLEGLNASKFITEDGDVDIEAIGTWVDRIAPAKTEETGPLGAGVDLGQGSRQSTPIGDDAAFVKMLDNLVK